MFTPEDSIEEITDWPELADALHNEGIDVCSMTSDEQDEALEIFNSDRPAYRPKLGRDLDKVELFGQIVENFANTRGRKIRTFCPVCGSTDLSEMRDATTFHKVKSVNISPSRTEVDSEVEQSKPASIGSPILWRCEECDFDTEEEEDLLKYCRIGGQADGTVTIDKGVRVEIIGPSSFTPGQHSVVRVDYFMPNTSEGWVKVTGNGSDTVTIPVATNDSTLRREVVMRRLAAEVTATIEEAQKSQSTLIEIIAGRTIELGDRLAGYEQTLESDEYLRAHTR